MHTRLGNVLLLFEEEEQPSAQRAWGLCLLKTGQVTGEANRWGVVIPDRAPPSPP